MNSSSGIKRKSSVLARRYQAALRRYLQQGPTANLKPAARLGQQAVVLGVGTLDVALIHEQVLIGQALPIPSSTARDRIIKRAGTFFAEAILPMEKTHRVALEANVHLSRLNQALSRRTLDLAASNRQLKKEIARRRFAEQTLRQSKQNSGRLLEQSRRLQEQLRFLSRGILSAQEEERKRISREMHDVIGQVLTNINVRLEVLRTEAMVNTKGITKSIAQTQRLVEKSVNIVRRFAYNLRPSVLDDLGLVPCLDSFMTRFMKETGIRLSLTAFAEVEKLSSAKRTALYRVAQEALANVARHAQASKVEASIQRLPKAVGMDIGDNGKGFELKRGLFVSKCKRLGLLGIRERVEMVGGKFAIESAPGKGTSIHAQIPFNNGAKEDTRP